MSLRRTHTQRDPETRSEIERRQAETLDKRRHVARERRQRYRRDRETAYPDGSSSRAAKGVTVWKAPE